MKLFGVNARMFVALVIIFFVLGYATMTAPLLVLGIFVGVAACVGVVALIVCEMLRFVGGRQGFEAMQREAEQRLRAASECEPCEGTGYHGPHVCVVCGGTGIAVEQRL